MDSEKVIKGIHQHCEGSLFDRCGECPYYEIDFESCGESNFKCRDELLSDARELLKAQRETIDELISADKALKLLKEQEAIEPLFKQDEKGIFVWCCGSCGAYMYHIYDGIDKAKEYAKYCRQCGKKVKWE